MSVTISDIMRLPSLRGAKLVAGLAGINRTISSISVMESVDEEGMGIEFPGYSSHFGQEIMITAFMLSKDNVDMQCSAIRRLHLEGEVGIIVFYVGSILLNIDQRLIDTANELKMPLIIMPERRLELRYGDVICEVMEAILEDRRQNTYFATEVIERISHIEASHRSINGVLSIIRDRVQCSIYLFDELGRNLNTAEWPNGRCLPISDLVAELDIRSTEDSAVEEISLSGKIYYVERETIQSADSKLIMVTVKEKDDLTVDCCKQIKYVLKTYINLWTKDYGQMNTKQLISAIINDEPEKMARIAEILHLDVESLSYAYFFYSRDDDHNFGHLQTAKQIIRDFLPSYKNNFLVDIFDETVVVFANRTRERIDSDLPNLLQELADKGLPYRVITNARAVTTQNVKEAYWLYQSYKKYIPIIFRQKEIITNGEVLFIKRAKSLFDQRQEIPLLDEEMCARFYTEKREKDLTNTLETFLLDADMDLTKTSQLLFVHKNTVKYRIKCIEDILGYKLNRMPESYDLHLAAALNRLNRSF
ncbi:PucR family transcriptional regulator [Lutispora sp.]|uniref:PucR family transcriptional regulator n=1 Tax=Lutispora sp. TaxID=2828727 RepID=UPI002B21D610|nr:PucR family transcriptional regulator [Lutispora sp.]MEA4963136.1 PucR family transcriptional regulator [Lutispora sp.]